MLGADGGPLQRSSFAPLYKSDLNQDEREVAVYLDAEKSLIWWHRNVAQHQYALQGWRRERIYPDFLFAVRPGNQYGRGNRLVVMETKGDHLQGNLDTEYKRAGDGPDDRGVQLSTRPNGWESCRWLTRTGPRWSAI